MSTPPRDRSEFWIRFGCSFLFFGSLFALLSFPFWDRLGLVPGCAVWFIATSGISVYAALTGDEAWTKVVNFIASFFNR